MYFCIQRRKYSMGKITDVYYEEIDRDKCSMMDAGEFYYHYNFMSLDPMFVPDYESYEMKQVAIRNRIIGDAIQQGELLRHPKINSTIFGVSALKNKAVLVTEY